MPDTFTFLFSTIGITATFAAIGFGIVWAVDRSSAARAQRDKRHRELMSKLEDIELLATIHKDRV